MSSLPSRVSASPAPLKTASATLKHASIANERLRNGAALAASEVAQAKAAEEARLKQAAKKKRVIKFLVIASVVVGGALAIYKREAIMSGFRNLLPAKQPVAPPEPVEVTVTNKKPLAAALASSPFIFELGRQLGRKSGSHPDAAKERASFERGERSGFSRGKAEGEKRGPTVHERLAQAQAEYESYRKGKAAGERLGKATGEYEGYRQGAAAGENLGYLKGKKISDEQRRADHKKGVFEGGKFVYDKMKQEGYRPGQARSSTSKSTQTGLSAKTTVTRHKGKSWENGKEVPIEYEVEEVD